MANKTPKANQTLERSCFIGKPLLELPYKEFEPTSKRIYDRFRGCGLQLLFARQPKGLSVCVVIWSLLAIPNALGLSYAKLECALAKMLFYRTSGRSYTSDLCYASITCAASNISGPGDTQSS